MERKFMRFFIRVWGSWRLARKVFLTGRPGVGKTTVLLRAVDLLRADGLRVGGMVSREVRERGVRIGFEILDLSSGRRGWLAHVNQPSGPRVGKYRVNMQDLEGVGVEAIRRAVREADAIAIDEIGPMELHSKAFIDAVREAIKSQKPLIATIHYKARHPLLDEVRKMKNKEIITVTQENRAGLPERIAKMLLEGKP